MGFVRDAYARIERDSGCIVVAIAAATDVFCVWSVQYIFRVLTSRISGGEFNLGNEYRDLRSEKDRGMKGSYVSFAVWILWIPAY